MARTNNNQDRTGRQARPVQQTEPPLPWHSAPQSHPGPQEPQFAPNYDVPPTQRPHATQPQNQLPWPSAAPQNGFPQHHPAPTFPPQVQQPYAPAPYQPNGYPQSPSYPADGHYYAPQQDPHGYPAAPHYADPHGSHSGYPQHADPAYPQASPYPAQQYANGHPADPRNTYDLGAYQTASDYGHPQTARPVAPHNPQGYAPDPQHYGHAQQQELAPHDDEDYEDDDYEDEDLDPPKRFRFLKIAASLVVAVSIGAAGAYAYKKFGLAPAAGTKQTLAKAEVPPIKVQSASADQSTKAGDRLGNQIPAVVPANDSANDNDTPSGPRRVQTIPITPNGAPAQPQQQQPPMRPTISVPGVALDGMSPQQQPASAASLPPVTPAPVGRPVAAPPVAAQPQRTPVAPKVIAAAEEQAPAKAGPPAQPKVAVAKAPPKAKSNDAFSPNVTVAAATAAPPAAPAPAPSAVGAPSPTKSASNGFIAVLASQGSAVDARNTLDDLQTRYGQILGGKPTDITEFANPKDGKTYYRAIVGPPGSREAAANICAQMKAASYKECFVTAY